MSPGSLRCAAASSIFIRLAMKSHTGLSYSGMMLISIRIFDPETQLSERKLLQVSIIPNVETQFDVDAKISLFEFLPENTVYWVQDWELTKERLLTQEEDLHLFFEMQANNAVPKESAEEDDKTIKTTIKADRVYFGPFASNT